MKLKHKQELGIKQNILYIVSLFLFSLTAFSFDLVDLKNSKLDESKIEKDVVLYFWATWCSECKAKIKSNFKSLDESKYEVILVNMDKNPKRAEKYINKYAKGRAVYRDHLKTYEKLFNISALPYWAHYKKKDGQWVLIKKQVGEFQL